MKKQTYSLSTVLYALAFFNAPALFVFTALLLLQAINFEYFIYAFIALLVLSTAIVLPTLNNLALLAHYVNDLAQDKRVRAPNLRFLRHFGAMAQALSRLQKSWEQQKQDMETVITEREILVDTLPDILIMTNFDRVIVRTNRAARNIFGQNLAGRHLKDIVTNEKLLQTVDVVIEDYHGQMVEFNLGDPINRDFQAVVERFPIPSEGGISIIITLNDITEQKRIQRMRADFVANASHEIRTPLASIIGFVETLRGPAKDDPVAREDFLKVMADQAERMSKLVQDLLSLSKIEMNAHNLPTGRVDILRLVRTEKQHFEWPAEEKKITIRLKLSDSLPAVRGDEGELAQVVRNLVGNAIKYGLPDTEVTITAKLTSDFPKDPVFRGLTRTVCFSVQDRGDGIAKEHIPRLTERFYRVDSARTRKVGGVGLGLAIVKHVLARHLGVMVIESEVGRGSTFSVYLPIYEDTVKK
jgi:two-component system, OmpR family, phosphate regulon sensor histidine kinase PhoR